MDKIKKLDSKIYHQAISDLQQIPGVGSSIAKDLIKIGIKSVRDLKDNDPEKLYQELETIEGKTDRCVLYVFRCAVYFASNDTHDPDKLKWWVWKDRKA